MVGLWDLLIFGIGSDGFTMTTKDEYVMIFDDGTLTEDIATVLNEGIDVSKARNPKDWGDWRKNGDKYEYKWSWDDDFDEPRFGYFQIQPGSNDQRLNDCFTRRKGKWCFQSDGSFSFSSSIAPDESGQYRIDGNILLLSLNDGSTKKAGFGFLNDEHNHILINTSRYQ
jgi:hypothetical protein